MEYTIILPVILSILYGVNGNNIDSSNVINDYYKQFISKSAKLNNTYIKNILDGQCKTTRRGASYTGNQSYSLSGEKCLSWESFKINGNITPISAYGHNYCRNQNNNSHGPWCYTENDSNGEICPIPLCKANEHDNLLYIENIGKSFIKMSGVKAGKAIADYGFPCIIILGTLFNLILIAVFRRPSLKGSTTSMLFIFLAIADILALSLSTIPT